MRKPEAGTRPGETAIVLPAAYDAGLYFIGRIGTPWASRRECPQNGAQADALCTIELAEPFGAGLADIETATHLIVLYWMHEASRDLVIQRPRHWNEARGTFSVRSPARPNPIALSVVTLLKVAEGVLTVRGLDCLDGTPLLDLKPYYASIDSRPEATMGPRGADETRKDPAAR